MYDLSSTRNNRRVLARNGTGGIYLGAALGAVGAADVLDVSAAVLVAPAIPPLERLQKNTAAPTAEPEWRVR